MLYQRLESCLYDAPLPGKSAIEPQNAVSFSIIHALDT